MAGKKTEKPKERTERDFLGEKAVPLDAYYGIHTARSMENFAFGGRRFPPLFIRSVALVKLACCLANRDLRRIPAAKARAVARAAREVARGGLADQFPLNVFQSGSGTSLNMNVNEVIAGRAAEILGGARGDRGLVHPNDDVNMGQSTNNVIPTAMRLSAWTLLPSLLDAIAFLEGELKKKARDFGKVLKSGRTHLQDAVPVTLGGEFRAYASALEKDRRRLKGASSFLLELGIGGSAVGTGINTPPSFRAGAVAHLNRLTGGRFRPARDGLEITQFLTDLSHLSAMVGLLSQDLNKIASDLRLLASGPATGLREIDLPPVEPGSSIMPGKVNPSIPEALNMICLHVQGNDTAIGRAAQAGQLELNTHMPLVAADLVESIELITAGARIFAERCVRGITANEAVCRRYFERSAGLATVLTPLFGYDRVSDVVRKALAEGKDLIDAIRDSGMAGEKEVEKLFSPSRLTRPTAIPRDEKSRGGKKGRGQKARPPKKKKKLTGGRRHLRGR